MNFGSFVVIQINLVARDLVDLFWTYSTATVTKMQYDVAVINAGHNGLMTLGHVAKHNTRRPPCSIYRLAL